MIYLIFGPDIFGEKSYVFWTSFFSLTQKAPSRFYLYLGRGEYYKISNLGCQGMKKFPC